MISLPDPFGPPHAYPDVTNAKPADEQPLNRPPAGDQTGAQANGYLYPFGYGYDFAPNGGSCANPCGFPAYGSLYLGTYQTYRWMLQHPIVRHARQQVIDPIIAAPWGYEAAEGTPEERLDLIKGVLDNLRAELVADMLRAIDYGWAGFEKVWRYDRGTAEIECMKPLSVDATGVLADPSGRFAGLRCPGIDKKTHDFGVRQTFLFTYDGEFGNVFGRSRLENIRATAWRDWLDGATDLAKLRRKISGKLAIMKTPTGSYRGTDGQMHPWTDVPAAAARVLNSDAVVVHVPTLATSDSIRPGMANLDQVVELSKASLVTLEIQDFGSNSPAIASILECQRANEERMFAGYYQSPRTGMATQGGTKADAAQHTDTATANAENLCAQIARAVTRGIVDDLLTLNYGEAARGSVWVTPAQLTDDNLATDTALMTAVYANPELGTGLLEKVKWPVVLDRRGIPHEEFEKLEALPPDDGEDGIDELADGGDNGGNGKPKARP